MRKPCCDKQDNNKGAWSKEEDQKLIDYIRKHGEGCWRTIPQAAGLLRCGKSCRLRWINYLRPDLKRGSFGDDEEDLIIKLHALLGNRWSLIAGRLPGRTDNEVKNYWNSHLRRKLAKSGVQIRPSNTIQKISSVATSGTKNSSTMMKISDEAASKVRGGLKCDQASDARSCLEDDVATTGSLLPDLNLSLTINVPKCPSLANVADHDRDKPNNVNYESECREAEFGLSLVPTLTLFR